MHMTIKDHMGRHVQSMDIRVDSSIRYVKERVAIGITNRRQQGLLRYENKMLNPQRFVMWFNSQKLIASEEWSGGEETKLMSDLGMTEDTGEATVRFSESMVGHASRRATVEPIAKRVWKNSRRRNPVDYRESTRKRKYPMVHRDRKDTPRWFRDYI